MLIRFMEFWYMIIDCETLHLSGDSYLDNFLKFRLELFRDHVHHFIYLVYNCVIILSHNYIQSFLYF